MSNDFHILPIPKLMQAARDCPLLEGNLEGWINCCSRRFLPLARRISGDDSLAEDVLQTSWIKILQTARACRGGPKACSWVHTIVTNAAKDVRRKDLRLREDALKADVGVSGVTVMLLADPAGVGADARGSWLHHRAFRQRGFTSGMGNVRFTGVPPGRIIARIKTADGTTEQRAVVFSGQEINITLRMLW